MHSSEPHRLAVIGDFGASAPAGAGEGARFRAVDRDDFDAVIARMAPALRLDLPLVDRLEFTCWRDFHPDGLIERAPALARLLAARDRAGDAEGSAQAMRNALVEAGLDPDALAPPEAAAGGAAPAGRVPAAPDPQLAAMSDGELLDSILSERERGAAAAEASGPTARALETAIREIVRESAAGVDLQEQDRACAAIDTALGAALRAVLRHPAFHALEASWAALRSLVMAAQTGADLRILVAHLPQSVLRAEIERGVGAGQSELYRLLVESDTHTPGEPAFDLVLTDYVFDAGASGRRELERLIAVAARARVPVLASAGGSALAVEEASEADLVAWGELRRLPGAERLGLAAGRLLLRLPYGADTAAIDHCAFEEWGPGELGHLLWAPGAYAVARAASEALARGRGLAETARFCEIPGLPLHVARQGDDEPRVLGPVDRVVTETRLEAWALMGLIPITGVRGSDSARILALRSLAGGPLFT